MNCVECRHDFDDTRSACPHCGRPSLYPNVTLASRPEERQAVQERYATARSAALSSGLASELATLESAVESAAVVQARWQSEVDRLVASDSQAAATYYQLIDSGVRLPDEDPWNKLRRHADEALHGEARKQIHMAALSPDGRGSTQYGDCFLTLRADFIAHRATVFTSNSAAFFRGVPIETATLAARGHRAVWSERAKVAVAKLASALTPALSTTSVARLIARPGATGAADEFIEVHVFGPMTIRTVESVRIAASPRRTSRALAKALRARLKKFDVDLKDSRWTP